jgi:hypothetical protein
MPITEGNHELLEVAAVETEDDYAVIGSWDLYSWGVVGFTITATVAAITFEVFGANLADYSDEIVLQVETTVAAGSVGKCAIGMPYRYCRIKAKSAVAGVPGIVAVEGIAKPCRVITL